MFLVFFALLSLATYGFFLFFFLFFHDFIFFFLFDELFVHHHAALRFRFFRWRGRSFKMKLELGGIRILDHASPLGAAVAASVPGGTAPATFFATFTMNFAVPFV